MRKIGVAELRLARTKAPPWLVAKMRKLARPIVTILIDEFGIDNFLKRLSNPYWFQCLAACLAWEWNSSGSTTVLTGVLRDVISPDEHGLAVVGGKGRLSRQVPIKLPEVGDALGLSSRTVEDAKYASKMAAKVDNTAMQAGYPLYHHTFFITEKGDWVVIQQGMNSEISTARRYHWLSSHVESFVEEPHDAIFGDVKHDYVLDMTAKKSGECRTASVDIVKDTQPRQVTNMFRSIREAGQKSLAEWVPQLKSRDVAVHVSFLPKRLNYRAVREAYEFQPRNFEELLAIKGVGPATVRGLALISELIYGESPSWRDPVAFNFAFGSKDGWPYPPNKEAMDEAAVVLVDAVRETKLGEQEKLGVIKRLNKLVSKK